MCKSWLEHVVQDLVEVLCCGSHLLPGFIEQLNADAEELLPCAVVSEEHRVVVVAAFISCTREKYFHDEARNNASWFNALCISQTVKPDAVWSHDCTDRGVKQQTNLLFRSRFYLRSSPTWSISHNIRVSSMAQRPNGHSCLSSRLLFSRTIWYQGQDRRRESLSILSEISEVLPEAKTDPDVGVLVNLGQIQHVIQSQHPRRSLGEVHGRVHMILPSTQFRH